MRTPPHNFEAEQALLGAILLNNRALEKVGDFLRPEHFADPVHGRIYAACGALFGRGEIANPVTLKSYFEADGGLAEIGGTIYLAQLANAVVSIINAEDYGKLIHDLHIRRELIALGEDLVNEAYEPKVDRTGLDLVANAEGHLAVLAGAAAPEAAIAPYSESLREAVMKAEAVFKANGALVGCPTGLSDLDKKTGGLQETDLVILAGRPSMGKSGLASKIARSAARSWEQIKAAKARGEKPVGGCKGPVLIFSMEMSKGQWSGRDLAVASGVPSFRMNQGPLDMADFEAILKAEDEIRHLEIEIDDSSATTVDELRVRATRFKRKRGLGLVVVDYLQLIGSEKGARQENRVVEVSAITRALKKLAKALGVPVVALSQLSRAVEQREDKRPQLADLRESGSIEQDADMVMFLYREQYYLEREEPKRAAKESDQTFNDRYDVWEQRCREADGKAEVIIAKHRHGPVGTVRIGFRDEFVDFHDLEPAPAY